MSGRDSWGPAASRPSDRSRRLRWLVGLPIGALAVLAILASEPSAAPPERALERLAAARTAYDGGEYAAAVRLYREVVAAGWDSPQLYYNLGCASYRAGQVGWAVAYLEQARRLAPRDPEIRHNLRIARAGLESRPAESERSWLLGWLTGMLDAYTPADAVWALLAVGWMAAFLLAAGWLLGRRGRRWIRRALRLVAVMAALGLVAAFLKAYQTRTAPGGVVITEQAGVLAGPREGEAVQFTVPEGTLLHLGRTTGSWREVWISEQMRGWLAAEKLTELRPLRWVP